MKPITSSEIRQAFLDFFQEMGHTVVPSAPLPVVNNPTLLFTNAGMNQFVDVFLGREERPYKRAASSQKVMRVQGKHNDLENVGPSPRHHTFFEMLGNFSFGDYFKSGAIRYAYDFLTRVCRVPDGRLWYTVHTSDDDAFNIWIKEIGVPPERVLRMGDKTNFWMMGDVGPCGPNSEIHYDWGPEHCTCGETECSVALDNGCNRWLEVWNLVFMQFDQDESGKRTPLPRPGVDTGMGLERVVSVVQQQIVNYDTDLFAPLMNRIQALLGDDETQRRRHETGYRVIADHGRAATFLIGDGVLPGNVGRGYVLRMIIRRAARFGRKIGFKAPFMAETARVIIEQMGDVYPELRRNRDLILHTVTREEERFARTLDGALAQLEELLAELPAGGQISGEAAFDLYATHGLPVEITCDVAGERGYTVDEAGFLAAREAHTVASGAGAFGQYESGGGVYTEVWSELVRDGRLDSSGVDYDPYSGARLQAGIVALIRDGRAVDSVSAGEKVEVVTAATCFYSEAGGEVSDTGWIRLPESGAAVRVDDARQPVGGLIVHLGEVVQGEVSVGQVANLLVDEERRRHIRRNHTATHVLHRELRRRLGSHVTQQGSLVTPERLRFDFSHGQAVDDETLEEIETAVNQAILENLPVRVSYMPQTEAIDAGATALFGEKYGEVVRTIKIGEEPQPYSFELCGGLHVNETGDIGLFHFTHEGAVAAGIRRVEAVTGHGAQQFMAERLKLLQRIAARLNAPPAEIEARLDNLLAENRSRQKEIEQLRRRLARSQFEKILADVQEVAGIPLVTAVVDVPHMDGLREMADWFRDRVKSGVAVLAAVKENQPILLTTVTDDLVERGVHAGNIVREVARMVGGSGGGRPNLAQAGGKDAGKLAEAMAAVPGLIKRSIKE
jgi:alanyl-tRNA synthetase